MMKRIDTWLRTDTLRASLTEIRQFLDTWYFSLSEAGHLYVRPLQSSVSRRDVRAFLKRLDVLGKGLLPKSIAFDFTAIEMSPRRWHQINEVLLWYANQIQCSTLVVSNQPSHKSVALIVRA
ncbi:MAG: hypothetical protein HS101_00530 [Planctomycetia bacterium]|jgi:hypothetical protein|nr:hypothetical protein [Planctomycetia bacterium]MCC7313343.1 hypothetical protein [Planctomycetota bacterium]OQZ07092.1 MAG: hypothetical protein B6D36_01615 [Planctomycetes bacterium UTPLA1]